MADKYKPNIILVEGSEDKNLIVNLIISLGLDYIDNNFKKLGSEDDRRYDFKVGVKEYNVITHTGFCKTKFIDTIKSIKDQTPDFRGIEQVLVIADADNSVSSREQELKEIVLEIDPELDMSSIYSGQISQSDQGVRYGYFMLPDNHSAGSLETLLLSAAAKPEVLTECVDGMINCLESKGVLNSLTVNQKDKIRLRLYLNGLIANYGFTYDSVYANEIKFISSEAGIPSKFADLISFLSLSVNTQ